MHTILCTDRRYPSSLLPGRRGIFEPGIYRDGGGEKFTVSGVFIHMEGYPSVAYLFMDKREAVEYYHKEVVKWGDDSGEGVKVELIVYN